MTADEGEHMRHFSKLVWGMYYLRTRFPGMSVTSWGRSAKHNRELPGAVPDSQHLEWTAVDVVWDPGTQPELGTFQAAARAVGLKVERNAHAAPGERDHDHLELGGDHVYGDRHCDGPLCLLRHVRHGGGASDHG